MKKDFLGILGLLIGILGICLSLYFYEISKKEREPTFIVEPIKSEILNKSSAELAPIRIFTLDGEEVKQDLTSLTFYFWNKGKEPIKNVDLLEKISLSLNNDVKILDFKIVKYSRKICGINLIKVNNSELNLDFDILEENDGFTGQIIYEGKRESKLSISTIIIGVSEVSNFAVSQYQLLGKTLTNIVIGILFIFLLLISSPSSSPTHEPDYVRLKQELKYSEDQEYRKKVDSLENVQLEAGRIRSDIYKNRGSKAEPYKDGKTKSIPWARIGITVGFIIIIGILIYAYIATKNEIYENPIQYIPENIKPNNLNN